MKFRNWWFKLTLCSIGWAACPGCSNDASVTSSQPAASAPEGSIDRVRIARPQRSNLVLTTTQPGRVMAFEETPLFAKLSGYVQEVLVDIGDRVQSGQTLIRLSIPELHDARQQKLALVVAAEAEEQQAVARIQAAEANIVTAAARVRHAQAGIGRASAEYQRWKSEHDRLRELVAQGAVTERLADEALSQLQAAEATRSEADAAVESAEAELAEAQAKSAMSQADLAAAQARRQVAEAELKQAQTLLNYAEIVAPFDGIITHRGADTGHFVNPAGAGTGKPLLVVASVDTVRVVIEVPEMEAAWIDAGDLATIRVQSLKNLQWTAPVSRIGWSLGTANRSLRAECDLENSDGTLRPGMFATVSIQLAERDQVLTLPVTSIIQQDSEAYCYVVESGVVQSRGLSLGLRSGSTVEVLSGLNDDQWVVQEPPSSLRTGQQVQTVAEESSFDNK